MGLCSSHVTQLTDEQLKERITKLNGYCKAGVKVCEAKKKTGVVYYEEKRTKKPVSLFRLNDILRAGKLMQTADLGKDEQGQKIASSEETRPPWTHKNLSLESTLRETFGLNVLFVFHKEESGSHGFIAANFTVPGLPSADTEREKENESKDKTSEEKGGRTILEEKGGDSDTDEEEGEMKEDKDGGKMIDDSLDEEIKEKEDEGIRRKETSEAGDEIILCFRSGSGAGDWKEHFQVSRVNISSNVGGFFFQRGIFVEQEFFQCFCAVEREITNVLKPIFRSRKNITLKVLGHSFGGAVSHLAAIHLMKNVILTGGNPRGRRASEPQGHRLEHFTFGSPRVGDVQFQQLYQKTLAGCRTFHLVAETDIVPLLPAQPDFVACEERILLDENGLLLGPQLDYFFQETLDTIVLPTEVMKDHGLMAYVNKLERIRRQKLASSRSKEEGNLAFKQDDFKTAIRIYSKALEKDSQNFMLYFNRSACHIKLKQLKEALADADNALLLDANSIEAVHRKGQIHTMRGENTKAKKCYQRVLQLDPTNSKAKTALANSKDDDTEMRRSAAIVKSVRERTDTASSLSDFGHKRASLHVPDRAKLVTHDDTMDPLLNTTESMITPSKLDLERQETKDSLDGSEKKRSFDLTSLTDAELRPAHSTATASTTSSTDTGVSVAESEIMEEPLTDSKETLLYTIQYHPLGHRTEIALIEKGVEFAKILIPPGKVPQWYLSKIDSEGRLPAFKHKDKIITDSLEMLLYIEDNFPGPNLLPRDSKEREKLIVKLKHSNKLLTSFTKFLFNKDQRETTKLRDNLSKVLLKHEKQIRLPYWMGDDFTLVDVVHWSIYHRLPALKYYKRFELSKMSHGNLHSWLAKVKNRASIKLTTFETGPFLKSLERDARPGPISFVHLFHQALQNSLDTLSERLVAIIGADEKDEIHDIEVSSLVKHFDQMFQLFEEHIMMCDIALFPFMEKQNWKHSQSFFKEHKTVRELTIGIKSELKSFATAKQGDRKQSAIYMSEAFNKFKTSFGAHLDEDERMMGPVLESVTWEEQAALLKNILQSSAPDMHQSVIWTFKHLADRNSRLQLMRNLCFTFSAEVFSTIIEWLESEASSEFASIEKQVRKMAAGRESETLAGQATVRSGYATTPQPSIVGTPTRPQSCTVASPILTPSSSPEKGISLSVSTPAKTHKHGHTTGAMSVSSFISLVGTSQKNLSPIPEAGSEVVLTPATATTSD